MIMSGLESLSSGTIQLANQDITVMGEDSLAALRRDKVGIVFQAFRLIPSMTAIQNVAVPLELAGNRAAKELAQAALRSVGLGHRLTHLPDQLSGESNSVSPSPEPLPRVRRSCSPMSQPEILTAPPARV